MITRKCLPLPAQTMISKDDAMRHERPSGTIRLSWQIPVSLDKLWEACSSAKGLARWYADEVRGQVSPGARLQLAWPALGAELEVTVEEVHDRERIVFSDGSRRVILRVREGRVGLEHEGLTPGDATEGTLSSWRIALGNLAHGLQLHPGRERSVLWALRSLPVTPELAHLYFTHEAALGMWLTRGGAIGAEGSVCQLRLQSGGELSGRVLACSPERDVLVSWEQEGDSTLAFRTLPAPSATGQRLVALVWTRWLAAPPSALQRRFFEAALAQLDRVLSERARC